MRKPVKPEGEIVRGSLNPSPMMNLYDQSGNRLYPGTSEWQASLEETVGCVRGLSQGLAPGRRDGFSPIPELLTIQEREEYHQQLEPLFQGLRTLDEALKGLPHWYPTRQNIENIIQQEFPRTNQAAPFLLRNL
jgi:hypothetical protein